MTKRERGQEVDEAEPLGSRNYQPRKFTVSSFTQQLDHRPHDPQTPSATQSRQANDMQHMDEFEFSNTLRSRQSRYKENTLPMLKTITIKINEMSGLKPQPPEESGA